MIKNIETEKQLFEELEQLRQFADGLQNILRGTNVGTWEWNVQTGETVFNDRWAQIVGYTLDELEPVSIRTWEALGHPEDLKQSAELLGRHFSGELPYYDIECRMKHKDGHWVWVHDRGQVVSWTDNGKPLMMYGSHTDISERKQAEEQLRKSKETAESYLNVAAEIILSLNAEGTITMLNESGHNILGYKNGYLVGKSWFDTCLPGRLRKDVRTVFEKLMRGEVENVTAYENTIVTNNGDEKIILWHNTILKDENGNIYGTLSSGEDITVRRQAEEGLKKSAIIIDSTTDAVITTDLEGVVTSWNKGAELIYEYKSSEIIGKPVSKLWRKEDLPKLESIVTSLIAGKDITNFEGTLLNKHGDEVSILLSLTSIKDQAGNITELVGITKDITERKRAEEAIRQSEERFRDLAELLPEAVFETDRNINLIFANQRAYELFGYSDEDLGRRLSGYDLLVPEDRDRARANMAKRIKGEESGTAEYRALKKDGSIFPVLFHASSIMKEGELVGIRGIIVDITERKRAEKQLQNSKETAESYLSVAAEIILSLDTKGTITMLNESGHNILGYEGGSLVGKNWFETCLPKRLRKDVRTVFEKLMRGEVASVKTYESPIVTKNGCENIILWHNTLLKDGTGNICGTLSSGEDITERKKAEEALIESEKRYQELFNSVMEGIGVVDENEMVKYVNPAFVKIFGENSAEDMLGKYLLDYFSESQKKLILLETYNRRAGENSQYELELTTTKGEKKNLYVSITPRFNKNNEYAGAFGTVLDITETKRLRELESRAARLETAGTIAGQVAHDFNNLLAPIMAYPELIREELPHDHVALAYIDDIEKAAKKIADINQDLLTLGRRGHYAQEVLNLNLVVLHAIQEMESRTKSVTCKTDLCKDLMKIKGGAAQIHRMLTNLLVNAQDAMQDMGQITIVTENYYADDTSVAFGRVPKGEYVKLTVSDNGCGIPDDIIQNIFDPFFSSKVTDKKRGSGLGLSIVDAVIKDHNGYLDLSSKIGHGTSFYLYFPVTREGTREDDFVHLAGGTETILIVDDDDIQRKVSSQLLAKLGYKVSSVESGEKATKFLVDNPQDLVILDMVMPGGIDGTETYRRILEICPRQKAIILSGFSESNRVFEAQKLGAGAFVRKPITKDFIAAAVRTELDR